jgi:hypothetical protein
VFFNNPPWGTANELFLGGSKPGMAMTNINKLMKKDNMGPCSQQLYAQFIYRIYKVIEEFNLTKAVVGVFTKTRPSRSATFSKLRRKLKLTTIDNVMFTSGEFSGTAASWAAMFSILKR